MNDAVEVICYKNLKRPGNFGDIRTDRKFPEKRETAKVFLAILGRRYRYIGESFLQKFHNDLISGKIWPKKGEQY